MSVYEDIYGAFEEEAVTDESEFEKMEGWDENEQPQPEE